MQVTIAAVIPSCVGPMQITQLLWVLSCAGPTYAGHTAAVIPSCAGPMQVTQLLWAPPCAGPMYACHTAPVSAVLCRSYLCRLRSCCEPRLVQVLCRSCSSCVNNCILSRRLFHSNASHSPALTFCLPPLPRCSLSIRVCRWYRRLE